MCAHARVRARGTIYVGEGEREKLFRKEAVAHWQPCSASSLLSFLTTFDIFNYVFHTWLGTCFFFFFLSMLSLSSFSSLFSGILLSHLPILFLHLIHSISFLSGCSFLALCGGHYSYVGGQVSPEIPLPPLCSKVWVRDGEVIRRRGWQKSEKDAVRCVRESCSIYLVILKWNSQHEGQKI